MPAEVLRKNHAPEPGSSGASAGRGGRSGASFLMRSMACGGPGRECGVVSESPHAASRRQRPVPQEGLEGVLAFRCRRHIRNRRRCVQFRCRGRRRNGRPIGHRRLDAGAVLGWRRGLAAGHLLGRRLLWRRDGFASTRHHTAAAAATTTTAAAAVALAAVAPMPPAPQAMAPAMPTVAFAAVADMAATVAATIALAMEQTVPQPAEQAFLTAVATTPAVARHRAADDRSAGGGSRRGRSRRRLGSGIGAGQPRRCHQ